MMEPLTSVLAKQSDIQCPGRPQRKHFSEDDIDVVEKLVGAPEAIRVPSAKVFA